jgi:hypothetical protein
MKTPTMALLKENGTLPDATKSLYLGACIKEETFRFNGKEKIVWYLVVLVTTDGHEYDITHQSHYLAALFWLDAFCEKNNLAVLIDQPKKTIDSL